MKEYWNKTDWSQDNIPSFSTVFTCDRFFQLQMAVHFPQIEGHSSKLQKVQAIVQIHLWKMLCCIMYWKMLGEISHKESFMTTYKF